MDSRPRIASQVGLFRTLTTPFLSFFAILLSLLAAPSPAAAIVPSGGYVPLVSFFLDGIRSGLLPPDSRFIVLSSSEPLEVYVVASVVLALLLSSPIIAYQVMKSIVSVRGAQKMVYSLTVAASVLFASGAVIGYLFLSWYVVPAVLAWSLIPPTFGFAGFYFIALRAIAEGAVVFALPVYIYALVRFRRQSAL